ncbi:sugar phosphate isomerase/epimerase [Paenibacillus sp. KQZ6P-2]|uniref:Sugar phosphate isomerase/epimerase n=1 Tax=Paenibacillus mangrovi TaxID=2931978 RepID=A0A9X1WTT5_9BACL|nr:sugar phosphate isomerase/epimerase family protein [Paenibacillus mangrovi]MCJ8013505.1 sugar phosphate isomerase/epimerase [Paenibacillus mangrovi]
MLTGFADEISNHLEEQMDVLISEGISHLELRSVYGKNVMELTDGELTQLKSALTERGIRVSSIGSPIGKYPIQEPFAPEIEKIDHALHIAKKLDAPYIRVFSYYIPENEAPEIYRDEVLSRMKQLTDQAERAQIKLLLENESGVYGNNDERCLDILQHCDSACLKLAFDPGNFVMNDIMPMSEAYPLLSSYLEYVHIKDADRQAHIFVPAGEGDGEFQSFVKALMECGYSGFLSIEPHLHKAFPEHDGIERFKIAAQALKKLLQNEGLAWS